MNPDMIRLLDKGLVWQQNRHPRNFLSQDVHYKNVRTSQSLEGHCKAQQNCFLNPDKSRMKLNRGDLWAYTSAFKQ